MKVVHCKREPYDVYIGRPGKWGNPFLIGKDGSREEVIEKYRLYLLHNEQFGKNLPDGRDLLQDLPELKGKMLGCWCRPAACHGDVLVELSNKQGDE